MRSIFVAIIVALLPASIAVAQDRQWEGGPAHRSQVAPAQQPRAGNSCAAYGPGFVKVEGSEICVQVGGSVASGSAAPSALAEPGGQPLRLRHIVPFRHEGCAMLWWVSRGMTPDHPSGRHGHYACDDCLHSAARSLKRFIAVLGNAAHHDSGGATNCAIPRGPRLARTSARDARVSVCRTPSTPNQRRA